MADTLPNGHRVVSGTERILLWSSIIILILGFIVSYVRTTSAIDGDLDRNCRVLIRIDSSLQYLNLVHINPDDLQAAQGLREAFQSAPQEICG
jgi:Tfp pilus assembly protein PilF